MTRQFGLSIILMGLSAAPVKQTTETLIGTLPGGSRFVSFVSRGAKGLAVMDAGSASVQQSQPVQLEIYSGPDKIEQKSVGYEDLCGEGTGTVGIAHVAGPNNSQFTFEDKWSIQNGVIELSRTVRVKGSSWGGFLSSVSFSHPEEHPRSAVGYFAPGMIYGGSVHLSPAAIGGSLTYAADGRGQVRIREDRLPAPVFGIRFEDGSAMTMLDPAPNAETTRNDSHDAEIRTLLDERFQFGALGADLDAGHHTQGFWFPGAEGEITYRGNTYPGGQVHEWRRRYHPIRDGLVQQYRVQFRFSKSESFPIYLRNTSRWVFSTFNPQVTWQNIAAARRSIIDLLASQVRIVDDRAGIPNFVPAVTGLDSRPQPVYHAIMGFTGKNLEAAEFLLADAQIDSDQVRAAKNRKLGLAIFASFLRLQMNPPVGEGFDIQTGAPALAIPRDGCVFLRSFGDDMKATLRAFSRERNSGNVHQDWLQWVHQFGDWLLTQQRADGAFPRSWKPGTGEIVDASPQSSYNSIPFLVLLAQDTGDSRYLHAAELAADYVWTRGQSDGRFVGGTIDNPDVMDKEAGTLSIEAYLALYEATHNLKWLLRAQAAADYAETWIYLWNVPMPLDEDNTLLHWKKGVPTCGTQLIATGHSLVDDYMSFDVDEYAKLGRWTSDNDYLEISKLLLHNTKNMLAVPGRTFDLKGAGWQQEHFSFAPVRGFGLHRLWLPWVATSQPNGIFGLQEFDPLLFQQWTAPERGEGK